ncbi:MAG: class I SAM-dependent methyltransferase [Nitrospiraceae bacterium]|nr:class I SAM-dependent methyltransferase [Nitrospiraceae bacterium]
MKPFQGLFFKEVCPWWLAWTFDNPLRRVIHKPEAIVGPYLHEGMTVADIGCGMGYFSLAMAKIVGEGGIVIAVDLQQKMLDLMQARAGKAGVAHQIHSVCATTEDIGIKDPVDFVLLFWMAHEVKNIPRFFGQIYSVLKKGGNILYVEPRLHVPDRRFQEILGHARQAGFQINDAPQVRLSRAAVLSKKG